MSSSPTQGIDVIENKSGYLKAVMYEGITILEGTAKWCEKCKVIAPEVAKMVAEYPNVHLSNPPLPNHYSLTTTSPLNREASTLKDKSMC
jgi:thiol-disulfide isomerase/thioredoxin